MSSEKLILIVDDNDSLTNTMSKIFQRKGFNVTIANSGYEALEIIKVKPDVDVVLMDIKMPDLNGVETYKLMKETAPNAIVIMMTAYAVEDLIAEALAAGVYGIIHKPMDIEKSIKLIDDAISKENGAFILVVDDDPGTLVTIRNILERKGYRVHTASDGLHALEESQENAFDVIFLDMRLPPTNGLDIYLKIRKIKPDTVFVLITGYPETMNDLVEQALFASAFICLRKPLEMSKIVTLVQNIMERKEHDS
jgi:DNA-binding NtrC family response regulator